MPESGTSGSMSGDGKRSDGQRPPVTAPILDSTKASVRCIAVRCPESGVRPTSLKTTRLPRFWLQTGLGSY
jgi:hypothetical protein